VVAKRHGVSEHSIHGWRKHLTGMALDEVKENTRMKKLLAERDLEIEMTTDITAKISFGAPARRIAAFYAIEREISQRRDCALMQIARSSLTYIPTLPLKKASGVAAMLQLSDQYPRYGSRRIRVFLGREGLKVCKAACQRLWVQHGLQVPKKRSRRRLAGSHPRLLAPAQANSVWSYDFVYDAYANGQ
jgi:hypothetical protein